MNAVKEENKRSVGASGGRGCTEGCHYVSPPSSPEVQKNPKLTNPHPKSMLGFMLGQGPAHAWVPESQMKPHWAGEGPNKQPPPASSVRQEEKWTSQRNEQHQRRQRWDLLGEPSPWQGPDGHQAEDRSAIHQPFSSLLVQRDMVIEHCQVTFILQWSQRQPLV